MRTPASRSNVSTYTYTSRPTLTQRAARRSPNLLMWSCVLLLVAGIGFEIIAIWTPDPYYSEFYRGWVHEADDRWAITGGILLSLSALAGFVRWCIWMIDGDRW